MRQTILGRSILVSLSETFPIFFNTYSLYCSDDSLTTHLIHYYYYCRYRIQLLSYSPWPSTSILSMLLARLSRTSSWLMKVTTVLVLMISPLTTVRTSVMTGSSVTLVSVSMLKAVGVGYSMVCSNWLYLLRFHFTLCDSLYCMNLVSKISEHDHAMTSSDHSWYSLSLVCLQHQSTCLQSH